jgi:hypothetical protein
MNMIFIPQQSRTKTRVIRFTRQVLSVCLMLLFVSVKYSAGSNAMLQDTLDEGNEIAIGAVAAQQPETDENRYDFTKTELRRGERLFNGLVPFSSGTHDCAYCHYTEPQQVINWNPSAYDLANVWKADKEYDLLFVMNNPMSLRLANDHVGMNITVEEARLLEAYFYDMTKREPGQLQAYPIRAAIFWGLGLLMAIAVIDLLFTKKVKYHFVHVLILVVGLGTHTQYAVSEARNLSRTPDYAPDQPIKFSHKIHSGDNEIDCRYCHHITDHSKSAGIPSNNVCLNCHNVIRNGTFSGAFEINKIHNALETGEPVRWVRVHNLPDHSFFSHAQHVNAGKLDCAECHGDVEGMHILRQVEDLSMGWCLDCHRTTEVDFANNPYYEMYEQLQSDFKAGRVQSVTAARVGGEDCMKCHY